MRRTLTATAAIALTAALAACTSAKVSTTPAPPSEVATTTSHAATSATASSAPKKAHLGDTIDISDQKTKLAVTLVKIVDPVKGADEFMVPDEGKHFVALQVRVINKGAAVYSDDPAADVKVKNAAGESMSIAFATTTAGADMPNSVDLVPGDTALGFVDFQVPDGQRIAQVQYAVISFGGDNVAQWTIG